MSTTSNGLNEYLNALLAETCRLIYSLAFHPIRTWQESSEMEKRILFGGFCFLIGYATGHLINPVNP